MFCPECGNEEEPDSVFCSRCGADLSSVAEKAEAGKGQEKEPAAAGGGRAVVVLVGIVALLVVALIVVVLVFTVFKSDGNGSDDGKATGTRAEDGEQSSNAGDEKTTRPSAGSETVTTSLGFALTYPTGWEYADSEEEGWVELRPRNAPEFCNLAINSYKPFPPGETLGDIAVGEQRAAEASGRTVKRTDTTIGGGPAVILFETYAGESGVPFKTMLALTMNGGEIYRFEYVSVTDDYDRYAGDVTEMLGSVRFTD
ncbi:MAG: zinc ribbon domain-containing protein [Actinobacteria bacterium]|nr:zinc ribbon domain-containing protein [Actinomycetota bacterium]MBU1944631.1 zinc ribbon domain-containing protein [Actinomycetota bacterium]MBU2689183.1 zinc ribbon domain-containing protein [Actinomycetota bacterium]